jgi:hypothetical protein
MTAMLHESFPGKRIHFKHVYGMLVHVWGVLGLPRTQTTASAGKKYTFGDPVLLAIPVNPEKVADEEVPHEVRGRVFGVCTLAVVSGAKTLDIANPAMVRRYHDVAARWPNALPVVVWHFAEPVAYARFGGGCIVPLAQTQRGKLIQLDDPGVQTELRAWMTQQPRTELEINHSERLKQLLARFSQPARS